ncbi:MAG: hypothetical protein ACI4AK_03180 [Lepagella sp.]
MIDLQHLNIIENDAIAQLVEDQIKAGLTEVTSGEFRLSQWDKDFWFGLNGIRRERAESGHIYQPLDPFTDMMRFMGRIGYNSEHPFFDDFAYLYKIADGRVRCRQTLPSPANLYLEILSMTDGKPEQIYPDAGNLLADIAAAYNKTIHRFYELGCRHIQLDDTACGLLCEDNYTKRLLQGGVDLIWLHEQIIGLFNNSVAGLPSDMVTSLYLSGGDTIVPEWEFLRYPDNIMPRVLSQVNVGKFYLPFEAGNDYQLEVLRHIPAAKAVVLGLADAHSPFTESATDILDTVAKASKYISRGCLSVSPKTGFKLSSYLSRGLTYVSQWQKLAQLKAILGD